MNNYNREPQYCNEILHTNGKGLWSSKKTKVKIELLELVHFEDKTFGELRVYFDKKDWNVEDDGLIYTDALFLKELQQYLRKLDILDNIHYSEAGMQTSDYVSLDAGERFVRNYIEKYPSNCHTY